ncbi:MAG: helix-turn-helix domain-containing protein [Bacteroidales bacterium]|nr:helix-turn-helix domain-containing protein [Candidatus Scybalousia scybalohippi]
MKKNINYTIDDIANSYGVTRRKASDWIRRGAIPFMRIKGTRIYVKKEEKCTN